MYRLWRESVQYETLMVRGLGDRRVILLLGSFEYPFCLVRIIDNGDRNRSRV